MQLINRHDIVFDVDGVEVIKQVVEDVGGAKEAVERGDIGRRLGLRGE